MALLLILETATKNCSIALSENGHVIESIDFNDGHFSHSEKLHVFIEEICINSGRKLNKLDAIAVSKGPGSYTGLRIGVSAAKGLCYGLNIPLISLETLEILSRTYASNCKVSSKDLIIPMIDARRMEVYTAVYDSKFKKIKDTEALILKEDSFDEFLNKSVCHFIGDGAEKSKELYEKENSKFESSLYPSAAAVAKLAQIAYDKCEFENVAYFEPYYLKDFVDGKKGA
jgi:tRNA threonylcarbamoyladenosine biosynthesis protein TsaB